MMKGVPGQLNSHFILMRLDTLKTKNQNAFTMNAQTEHTIFSLRFALFLHKNFLSIKL